MIPSQMNPETSASTDGADSNSDEKTMRLGVGEFAEDTMLDPLANAGTGKKLNVGSMVIFLVIVIAFGALWGLRRITQVSASTGASADVELTIEKFLKGLKGGDGKSSDNSGALTSPDANVLSVLNNNFTQRQVPLNDVQRNPFILYGETTVTAETPVAADDGGAAHAKQRTEREEEFKRAAAGLHLKTVIMGTEPLANVSGKIVRTGEEIADNSGVAFKVTKITPDAVTVVAEDSTLEIKVEVTLTLKRFN